MVDRRIRYVSGQSRDNKIGNCCLQQIKGKEERPVSLESGYCVCGLTCISEIALTIVLV